MFYDLTWRKKMLTAPAGTFDPIILKAIKEAVRLKADGPVPTVTGEQFSEASLDHPKAKAYYEEAVKKGTVKENDNKYPGEGFRRHSWITIPIASLPGIS
jgi:hypothetical protein